MSFVKNFLEPKLKAQAGPGSTAIAADEIQNSYGSRGCGGTWAGAGCSGGC